jgi:hypothetical protein
MVKTKELALGLRRIRGTIGRGGNRVGRASNVDGGPLTCPEESIDGDEFRFRIPDGVRFESSKPHEVK